VGDSGSEDPEDPDVPDSDDHGTGNPGTDHPSTGHPGTANPGHSGADSSGSGGSGTGSTGWVADTGNGETTSVDPEPTEEASAPTTSPGSVTPSRRPADAGDPVVLAEAPQLETVSFREAGLVSSGFVLVAIVVLGFLLYRRRSRRER
jgi:hypothetical protein